MFWKKKTGCPDGTCHTVTAYVDMEDKIHPTPEQCVNANVRITRRQRRKDLEKYYARWFHHLFPEHNKYHHNPHLFDPDGDARQVRHLAQRAVLDTLIARDLVIVTSDLVPLSEYNISTTGE